MTADFRLFNGILSMSRKTCTSMRHQNDCVRGSGRKTSSIIGLLSISRLLGSCSERCSIQSTDAQTDASLCRLQMVNSDCRKSSVLTAASAAVGTGSPSSAGRHGCGSKVSSADPRSSTLRYAEPGCLTQADVFTLIRVKTSLFHIA